ncbi:ATP-binding protein [Planosporangium sp. 12N6]|uniref:ATP-binding protein n=1 Tax=Planosporangium spinosum TaxID=3402278 RepID=UPI003CF6C37B
MGECGNGQSRRFRHGAREHVHDGRAVSADGRADDERAVSADGRADDERALLAAIVRSAGDAIVSTTLDGVITTWNPAAERLFGYPAAEVVGRHTGLLWPEDQRAETGAVLARLACGERVGRYRTWRQRRDGTPVEVVVTPSAIRDDTGTVVGVAAVCREPVERPPADEHLDGRLQQAQRLESLGHLAGGVAHDFNNLLAVIVNYAAFVAEEIETAATADPDRWHAVARDVQQIQRATDRGIALTHQLLAFGRREVVRPRVLSLNTVVTGVRDLLVRSIGEHVQLATELAPVLWPVKADPGQIEQILVNLAVNARDAMPGGGTLTIGTRNMIVGNESELPAGRYVGVRVADTGTGMPRQVVTRAFEPFFTTKPKGEGTGLGLATVYGIVKQAGGDVRIISEPGVGTTFTVLLPATDEALDELEVPVAVGAPSGGGETVLVVEDEPAIREVARRILRRHGYEVLMTESPLDALDVARAHGGPIHLLMTDVVMPKMLGKDVAERIRALRPDVKVLYMSGYARPVLASSGTLEPGVTLLEKPFTETVLLEMVRLVLDAT